MLICREKEISNRELDLQSSQAVLEWSVLDQSIPRATYFAVMRSKTHMREAAMLVRIFQDLSKVGALRSD